jgi:hypothetical protein
MHHIASSREFISEAHQRPLWTGGAQPTEYYQIVLSRMREDPFAHSTSTDSARHWTSLEPQMINVRSRDAAGRAVPVAQGPTSKETVG